MPRTKTFTNQELIEVARGTPGPFFTTSELAEKLDVSTETIRNRLDHLREGGVVDKKTVGSGAAWWLTAQSGC